ncbi:unnamed protein product [marine sediment metagenome]|uniref:Uncharacterized protein n=1 Tax=marine sediment metagenome TaxID=412755 RepID=X1L220_9ZZZZ
MWGSKQSTTRIITMPAENEIAIKNRDAYFKPWGISCTKDMAIITLAAKDKEPNNATLPRFLMRPINEPRICPAKIRNKINKKSFI